MNKSEKETQILANAADAAAGFFTVTTTSRNHYRKLLKRIGGEQNLKKLRVEKNSKGKIVFWACEIPIGYWSKSHFGIKSHSRAIAARKRPAFHKKSDPLSIKKDTDAPWMKNDTTVGTRRKKTPTL